MSFIEKLLNIVKKLIFYSKELNDELLREKRQNRSNSDEKHFNETLRWIARAQDANQDNGVSRGYSVSTLSSVRYEGWEPSYPETTGYIIPTLLSASRVLNDETYRRRAIRMADWEIDIQLESGAVMGSVVTATPSPAVFNTGQVIFGLLAAFKENSEDRFKDALIRAGDYLVKTQDYNGSWHKGDSKFARKGSTTYNTRVAWSLIELGLELKDNKFVDAGQKNIEQALTKQQPNGWFSDNCLNNPDEPLLHTIVYALRGILESGVTLNEYRYVNSARKTLDALLDCQREDGGIPGRLASDWSPRAKWDCLTGDAQAAVAWLRLHSLTGEKKYHDSARKIIEFIKRSQNLEHANLGIRGGVKGSFPFDGPYGQYEILNWGAKFFCDALMLINDKELAKNGIKG